jgi:hypothetical protein
LIGIKKENAVENQTREKTLRMMHSQKLLDKKIRPD